MNPIKEMGRDCGKAGGFVHGFLDEQLGRQRTYLAANRLRPAGYQRVCHRLPFARGW